MEHFLLNKNLSLYYWLRKRIGKKRAFWVANAIEKGIHIFGKQKNDGQKIGSSNEVLSL